VAAALLERGHEVGIGTRHPAGAARRLPGRLCGCKLREAHFERLTAPADWEAALEGIDVVVNAVGILRERGSETYEGVHHLAPGALASACARLDLRLIHVSALGLHAEARSGFIRSKLRGERAVAASGAEYSIVRPSLLEGAGGFGARWLRGAARLPMHFVPADATGKIAVMDVRDLGVAIAVLCEMKSLFRWREVELGGSERPTMCEYLQVLRARSGRSPALRILVPASLARIASHVCDFLHFSPFSFGHLELMRRDNAPRHDLLPLLLRRSLGVLGGVPPVLKPAPVPLRRPALEPGGRHQALASAPTGHETPVPPRPQ
jgi:NADH dehydrogenase